MRWRNQRVKRRVHGESVNEDDETWRLEEEEEVEQKMKHP